MSIKVKLPIFEGPFDLLVYLIENARMSIYDIQIAEITDQFMDYVKEIRNIDFNVASEFMVLAATLINIKSKMILPRPEIESEIEYEEDPRSELVERIIEYKRFKACAAELEKRFEQHNLSFEKPKEDITCYLENPDEYLKLDIDQFAQAFSNFLSKKQREEAVRAHYVRVEREKETIESRISYIKLKFEGAKHRGVSKINMKELIVDPSDNYDVVVTFVSILQMVRDRQLDVEQDSTYGDINVMLVGKGKVR